MPRMHVFEHAGIREDRRTCVCKPAQMCECIEACVSVDECIYSRPQVGSTQHTTRPRIPAVDGLPADQNLGILQLGQGKMGCGFVGLAGMNALKVYRSQ